MSNISDWVSQKKVEVIYIKRKSIPLFMVGYRGSNFAERFKFFCPAVPTMMEPPDNEP